MYDDEAGGRESHAKTSPFAVVESGHLIIAYHVDVFTIEFRLLPSHEVVQHRGPGLNEAASVQSAMVSGSAREGQFAPRQLRNHAGQF